MNIFEPVIMGLGQLRIHKLRASLSILGILISVGSVTGIVSLGDGLRATVTEHFEQTGGPSIINVRPPNSWYRNSKGRWVQRDWEEFLENKDIDVIENASEHIKFVAPVFYANVPAQYRKISTSANVRAGNEHLLALENWKIDKGRFINEYDVKNASKVAVVGDKLAEDLYGDENPVGKELKVENIRYLVVGVLAPLKFMGNTNDRNLIGPYTTVQARHTGDQRISSMTVMAESPEFVPEVALRIRSVLKHTHEHGEEFEIRTGNDQIESFNRVVTILKIVAGGIAGISLLVGGIGIMNIMLVSVTERTREIGLRKAIGARQRTILFQFIIESMVLCLFGGALGLLLGLGLGAGLEAIITHLQSEVPFNSIITPGLMIFAVLYSAAIGIFFGVYPAYRASKLDPVEALRK
ncbi:ABC transporter permease [Candidatus Latescibacterota bacterium]